MDMSQVVSRVESLVGALETAILATVETAAERIGLAAEVAKISQRMTAFGAVLEAVGAQKSALIERRRDAAGTLAAALNRQIEVLGLQEIAILERMGCAPAVAQQAIALADALPSVVPGEGEEIVIHKRGRKGAFVPRTNGTTQN